MNRVILLCLLFILFGLQIANAQVTVNKAVTASQLAQAMVGPNVIIANPSLTCNVDGFGLFTSTPGTNLNMSGGILLTSGDANNAIGPNSQTGITGNFNGLGDVDLDNLVAPILTHDACALEFDVFVMGKSISFNYVFASDEYEEFANLNINDAFALFISGPGLPGLVNMSYVPSSTQIVSINTINCTVNNQYYVCNDAGSTAFGGVCTASNCPANNANALVEYDGFTTKLTANSPNLQSCNWYHLKLVIADGSDWILDSGIFLEGGSLIVNGINVNPIIGVNNSYPNLVEGCINGLIEFERICDTIDTLKIAIEFDSSAVLGVNYNAILNGTSNLNYNDTITFMPGDTLNVVDISAIIDNVVDSIKFITIRINYIFAGDTIYDSVTVMLQSKIFVTAPNDTFVCENVPISLAAKGWGYTPNPSYQWQWTPVTNIISGSNTANPTFQFTNTSTAVQKYKFYVRITDIAACPALDSVEITVKPEPVADFNTSPSFSICSNNSFTLTDNSTINISGPLPTFNWTFGGGLSIPGTGSGPHNVYFTNGTGTNLNTSLSLTVIQDGCVSPVFIQPVTVFPKPIATISGIDKICNGEVSNLSVSPLFSSYLWSNNNSTNDSFFVTKTGKYKVYVVDNNGCKDTADFTVIVKPTPIANAGDNQSIYQGSIVYLDASNSQNGDTYLWQPASLVSNPVSSLVSTTPMQTTTYYLYYTDLELGCIGKDSVTIFVRECAPLIIPNAFTPNNDGLNDYFIFMNPDDVYVLHTLSVFNRWGQNVFTTNDKFSKGWDGTLNGMPQEIGTYTYHIVAACGGNTKIEHFKGDVTLFR
jgi:gliding motility-associated-like protein